MPPPAPSPVCPPGARFGDARPIGVFDSGVGGLTVARALTDLLPDGSVDPSAFGLLATRFLGPRITTDDVKTFVWSYQ